MMITLSKKIMSCRYSVSAILFALMMVFAICGLSVSSYASKADLVKIGAEKEKEGDPVLVLVQGMADIVPLNGAVADIMVANPSIVDVMALQSDKLYVVGVNYGTTNIIAVDEMGNVISRLNVHVKIDDVAIQSTVDRLFPNEDVDVTATADQVMLTGHVSTPDVAQRIADLVTHYVGEVQDLTGSTDELIVNMLTVSGEQQVMLRVKVVEASREILRELGIETNIAEATSDASLTGSFATAVASGLTADPLGIASVIYDPDSNHIGPLNFVLRALEDTGLVNTLAEPNLTAISGEQAGFLAGGEFPIPTSRDRDGNIVVSYRPFGVALNFRPVVLSNKRISLQLQTEVSTISTQNSLVSGGLVIPGFAVRRAETTVELSSGGSLMIAGLMQSQVTKGLKELPGIKNVPILGDLISSDSFQREESELVIIVTAFLVQPFADPQGQVKEMPEEKSDPLARAFARNIRRTYSKLSLSPDLFSGYRGFGYLIN